MKADNHENEKIFIKRYTLSTASVPVRVLESGGEGGLQRTGSHSIGLCSAF